MDGTRGTIKYMEASVTQETLKGVFGTQRITDLLVTGFMESEQSCLRFHPMFWWVYIRFESCFLRCQAVDQWFLRLHIEQTIQPQFEVEADAFCVASIYDGLVFNSDTGHRVKTFDYLVDPDCDVNKGIIKAGGFQLDNGDSLFFDPSSNEGIRIGTRDQVLRWTSLLHAPLTAYTEEKWEFA